MLKKCIKLGLMSLLLLVLTCCITPGKTVKAESKWFNVNLSATTSYHSKLTWKKKSVSYYKIYRAPISADTGYYGSKLKKIAKISGKKTSFIDKKVKKNKSYRYVIKGYKKGKVTYIAEGSVRIGVADVGWDDYFWAEGYTSPTRIDIEAFSYDGIRPEGFVIYRKEASAPKSAYKKIATVKGKSSFKYKDTSVTPYTEYHYRVRAYRTIKKHRVYGPYSEEMYKSAGTESPSYKVEVITAPTTEPIQSFQVKISPDSESTNKTIYAGKYTFSGTYIYSETTDIGDELDYPGIIAQKYSFDGVNWEEFPGPDDEGDIPAIAFDGNKPFYLEFSSSIGLDLVYPAKNSGVAAITGLEPRYGKIPYIMDLDLNGGGVSLYYDSEAVH